MHMELNNYSTLREFIIAHNKKQSELFCSGENKAHRILYRAEHPTELLALKCMDGRLNLPLCTETPPGIIQPIRNLGGKFNLGWPYLNDILFEWTNYAVSKGRRGIMLVTYHYSQSNPHFGCAGFGYDTEAAKAHTSDLVKTLNGVVGNGIVVPLQVGIETDEDSLIFHRNGAQVEVSKYGDVAKLIGDARMLFEDLPSFNDLIPLIEGNWHHVQEIRKNPRNTQELQHAESILCIGRGFDWLHLPNSAFIVGPYQFDMSEPVLKAGKLLLDNLKSGRVDQKKGILVMTSAPFRDPSGGFERNYKKEKSKELLAYAKDLIEKNIPELYGVCDFIAGVTNMNTREYEIL